MTGTSDARDAHRVERSDQDTPHFYNDIEIGFCIIKVAFDAHNRRADYRFVEVNAAFEKHTGLIDATGQWMRNLAPDHEQFWFDRYAEIARTGRPARFEYSAQALGGRHFEVYAYRTGEPEEQRVAILFADISVRKRQEKLRAALFDLTDQLAEQDDVAALTDVACGALGRTLGVQLVGFGLVNAEAETIAVTRDWTIDGAVSLAGVLRFRDFGSYIDDLKRGETVVVEDARIDPRTRAFASALEGRSARAFVNTPIFERGRFVALQYVSTGQSRAWAKDELQFIREVGARTRAATARRQAERSLRASEARQRRLLQQMPSFVGVLSGPDHVYEYVNDAYVRTAGPRAYLGRSVRDVFPDLANQGFFELLDQVYATGVPFSARTTPIRFADEDADRYIDFIFQPTRDDEGAVTGIFIGGHDVTDRANAEATVRDERDQARHREVVAHANAERVQLALGAGAIIGTWFWDMANDRFAVDEGFAKAFGLDPALGRDGLSLEQVIATVHPDDQAGLVAAIETAVAQGGGYAHQYRVRRTDGRYHWIEANGRVDCGPDGRPRSFPGVLLDVAARRHEALLIGLAERLRTLDTQQAMAHAAAETVGIALGLSRVAYGDMDATGRHITLERDWIAPGQRSIAGMHDFEAYGSYIAALHRGEDVVIDDVATDPRTVAQADNFGSIAVGALVNLPLMERGRLKVVFCLNHDRPHAWSADELAFARQVMERAEVEIARRAAEDGLRTLNASLERQVSERTREYDRSWRLSSELLVAARPDGTLEAVNPAWTATLGWEPHELLGAQFVDYTHPEDLAETMRVFGAILERPLATPYEYRFRHRDGTYRWIAWTAAFEDDRVYAAGRDTTVEREQAEALRQSQKMEAVGQLTGGVAHDFNNLLTIIRSSVDFLRRPELPEARKARYLDAVSDTVDRAAKLTGQLLAFARRQALTPEVFDVGAKLRGVADMLDTVTGSRVHVSVEVPDEPRFARADVNQFETALVNMAVNARDAMDGEGRLTLRLSDRGSMPQIRGHAASAAAFVALSVADTGTGIAPDRITRIFEPFFTTKEVGKGTGLGLSQVFGFAKQSGGDVDVRSVPGEGTTFTLYLPEEAIAPAGARDGVSDALASPVGVGQHVLVVEDNIEVGQFCTQILEDLGYVTEWSANAEEALVRLGDDGGGFDVVFSDVVMPGMGGVALAETLRERFPALPVVLASGYSHVLARADDHGFELLHKPYSAEQLARILQRVHDAAGGQTHAKDGLVTNRFAPPHPASDAERLAALDAYGILDTAPEREFDGIVLLARMLCAAPTALVSLVADDHQWFKARSGFGPDRTPLSQSVCVHALRQPGMLVIIDLADDPRTRGNSLVTGKPHLRFYAGAPLRTPEGLTLGTLCVLDTVPRSDGLTQEQSEGLQALAAQVMANLDLRRDLVAARAQVVALQAKLDAA